MKSPPRFRLIWLWIILFAGGSACVRKAPELAPTGEPTPKEVEAPTNPVDDVLLLSESLFVAGKVALESGRRAEAISLFDEAVLVLLECQAGLVPHGELDERIKDLIARIHQAEIRTVAARDPDASPDPSTLEKLLEHIEVDLAENLDPDQALETTGGEEEETAYDMPMTHNRIVDRFIEVFTTDRAWIIEAGLERSTRYLPMMRQIFEEEGLPLDLSYLPLIESAYETVARSRARAVGLWQFVLGTARMYGLKIDWWVDERMDPEKATRAAARHLKDLYAEFDDWYLALSAYNAGAGRVRRAIRRGGTRDFWRLYTRRLLPRETRGYVPAFLAGLQIAKNPKKYGFSDLEYQAPARDDIIEVPFGISLQVLAEKMDMALDELARRNPSLRRKVTPTNRQYPLRIPAGTAATAQLAIQEIPEEARVRGHRYTLRRGDTLSRLAVRFDTTVQALMLANEIGNPRRLRPGRVLFIPTPRDPMPVSSASPLAPGAGMEFKTIRHRVRRGDTLYALSKIYHSTIPSIMALNPNIDPLALIPGDSLTIQQGDRWQGSAAQPPRGKGYTLYTVKRGDSMAKIARNFGLATAYLLQYNDLHFNAVIHPGQRVKIPNSHSPSQQVLVYKIRRGDTLSTIAARYGTRIDKLMEWNRLPSKHRIREGQTLLIYR